MSGSFRLTSPLRGDADLTVHAALAGYLCRLGLDRLLLVFRSDRPLERHLAILGHDLDVLRVRGHLLVFGDRATNLTRQLPIGAVLLLLVGGDRAGLSVLFVHPGVVGWGLFRCPLSERRNAAG